MGNKRHRAPRRKYWRKNTIANFSNKSRDDKTSPSNEAMINDVKTEDLTVVDVVSILNPIPDVQYEHNYSTDPITPITENRSQDVCDPLFVVKSEEKSPLHCIEQSTEFPVVDVKIEPIVIETEREDERNLIALKNQCRLCLAKNESTWIEIFTSEPYPFSNVHEITPSNIVEIIEQFSTIKISKNDRLPDRICVKCFQSLRFVHKFREKSLRAQSALNSEVNALSKSITDRSEQNEEKPVDAIQLQPIKKLVKVVQLKKPRPIMKPIRTPVPNPKKHLTFEEAYNLDKEREKFANTQCEVCGKYKPLQYHMNKHNGVRPFACTEPYCDKSFFSPENRKNHILNAHTLDPKFKCDLCDKTYNKAEKLKIHRTVHFPPTIPCTICGKLLRSQASIRKHKASHAERLYRCDDCGKSFQNGYTLKVHRRLHTQEKPFICCKCGEAFAHKCLLKTHDEKKHAD